MIFAFFQSVTVNSVYKLQLFYIYIEIWRVFTLSNRKFSQMSLIGRNILLYKEIGVGESNRGVRIFIRSQVQFLHMRSENVATNQPRRCQIVRIADLLIYWYCWERRW